ncbi:chromate transporter [Oribacterium sp. C9]|uniref:chromate transporter n=1 Tax=Oribacterium sp. C9 TaxID=1943579 RepID=UPI00098F91D8|nr:chromate transporter [Oribacterium sp. C9]OON86784.1 chromate transporter [Oribacterium sp. C9]
MIYLELFLGFLKVGFFAFGGGYAVIPLIRDVVMSHGWLDDEMISYMVALSESTPGPIMVNMATYVGASQAGIAGAILAASAVVLPSFFIILLLAALFKKVENNRYIKVILGGLKPCMIGIILATGVMFIGKNCQEGNTVVQLNSLNTALSAFQVNHLNMFLTVFLAICYFGSAKIIKKGISPIQLIVLSAIFGMVVFA